MSYERYQKTEINSDFDNVSLENYIELTRGVTFSKNQTTSQSKKGILRANNIDLNKSKLNLDDLMYVLDEVKTKDSQKLKKDDIFICLASGSKTHIGKVAYVDKDYDYFIGGFMGIIRCSNLILPKYLYFNLSSIKFNNYLRKVLTTTSINNLNKKLLYSFQIPLPPLDIQKEIVEELEQYQKVIDGAQQVVDNYKPHFEIDENWDQIKIENIGIINNSTYKHFEEEEYIYIDVSSVGKGNGLIDQSNIIKSSDLPSRAKRKIKKGSVIISSVRPNLKGFSIIDFNPKNHVVSTGFMVLDVNEKFDNRFIYYSFYTKYVMNQMIARMGKGSYPSINQADFKELSIYIPSIEHQVKIADRLDFENSVVQSNKKLIEIYSKRIEDRINKIWGE